MSAQFVKLRPAQLVTRDKKVNMPNGKTSTVVTGERCRCGDAQLLADFIDDQLQLQWCYVNRVCNVCTVSCIFTYVVNALFKNIIELFKVFDKLSRINVYHSYRPDGIPNWLVRDFVRSQCVTQLIRRLKVV